MPTSTVKRNPAILNKNVLILGLSLFELFIGVTFITIGRPFISFPFILLLLLIAFFFKRSSLSLRIQKSALLRIKVLRC